MSDNNALAIAKARIVEEAERSTGSLDLSGLALDTLPSELASLTDLQHLDCGSTQVSDLTLLSSLTDLQQLNCWNTQVSDLTPLANLSGLRHLDLSRTPVSDLTPLANLTFIHYLRFTGTQVPDLTPVATLTSLQHLDCGHTQVIDLTPLVKLQTLQRLHCAHTLVSDLTPLTRLNALQELDCFLANVSTLTPLGSLTLLQRLVCGCTQVSDLRPLSTLTKLQLLDCWNTLVTDLTPLANLVALQHLNCGHTLVSDLTPVANLPSLQNLYCGGCRIRAIPPAIRNNTALKLYAPNIQVPGLPYAILSKDVQDDCRARVKAHYDDQAAGTSDLPDIKLLLLGNGGVGKTQIARRLSGAEFNLNWDSSHGITITVPSNADSPATRLHLQLWDFGGQDIYHSIHTLFLRGPAILAPIWAKDRENRDTYDYDGLPFRNRPLAYWIDVIRHQASPEGPVLILQNKCDQKEDEEKRFPIPEPALNTLQYSKELHYSAQNGRGQAALEEALQDAIQWLRDPTRLGFPKIGAGRLRVQRRLEALRNADMARPPDQRLHRLLTRQDFETICAEEGGVSSPALLLDYLDANGAVIYRPGLFTDQIILDQGWALEAIYALFDRKRVYQVLLNDEGRFSQAKLALMIWHDHTDTEQKLLLSMMLSCGICFRHRRFPGADDATTEYIAPDLLPNRASIADRLTARWTEHRQGETAIFRYPLLHSGLIRSIMAEIGQVAGIDGLYWRGGLSIFDKDTSSRLLIEEEMIGDWQGAIQVRTQDGQAATLLQKAVQLIEQIQTRLSMQPAATERSSPAQDLPPSAAISPGPIPKQSQMPDWYVSYAWGDDRTPEGRNREQIVDQLCEAAKTQGRRILRDKDVVSLGDSISAFMKQIGTGDRVFVILSEKYLRSPFCMFELSEIWRTSQQHGPSFLDRVRIYALPDANVFTTKDRFRWAIHWKDEFAELDAMARQHGPTLLGARGHRELMQMQTFSTQVAEILGTLADTLQPRTFEDLQRYGFQDSPARKPKIPDPNQ